MPAPWVSLDCTGPATVAVLRQGDGRTEPLRFEGAAELPSGVFLADDGRLLTGREALDAAITRPDRYVAVPMRQVTGAQEADHSVTDVLAALLTRVRQQASQTAGTAVDQAVVVVPPGWGPQRRTKLRHAAHRAGLTEITMVDAATSLARHNARPDGRDGQTVILVCRVADGTAEATILRTGAGMFEVLATIDQSTIDVRALIRQALEAADVAGTAVTTVLLDAPPASLPAIGTALRELGVTGTVRTVGSIDAVHGALTHAQGEIPTSAARMRPGRHAIAIAIPLAGAATLLWLLLHTGFRPLTGVAERLVENDPSRRLIHWPAWSMVVVLACFGALAVVLHHVDQLWKHSTEDNQRRAALARGLHVTAVATTIAGLVTAMLGASILPVPTLLLWVIAPSLVLSGIAAVIAALARHGHTSALRWQIWLRLPNTTVVLAVIGLLAVHIDVYLRQVGDPLFPAAAYGRVSTGIDRLGTVAIALAILPLLLRRIEHQILASPLVIAVVLWTYSFTNTSLVTGALLLAASAWWVQRIRPATAYRDPSHPASILAADLDPAAT